MRIILPLIATSRKAEARETLDALIEDLAAQTGASARKLRSAVGTSGLKARLERLCLALVDHLGISGIVAPATKSKTARERRAA